MPFTYHPPTRDFCHVCEELTNEHHNPIIETQNGKASSASNFPFHNWFYFVLGYSPQFPNYVLDRERITPQHFVVDPFMGTGTTLVACKTRGVPSGGVDANDFFSDVGRTKLNWQIDTVVVRDLREQVLRRVNQRCSEINFNDLTDKEAAQGQLPLFNNEPGESATSYATRHRMLMLDPRYISDKPFTRWHIIKTVIDELVPEGEIKKLFDLAIAAILVPVSNVRYGPGFGVIKPKDDVDVLGAFKDKINRMISDLESAPTIGRTTSAQVIKGDSRQIASYWEPNSVDLMITSPPYPGDHEYTKHTRLELIAMGYANDQKEFQVIKKRMLRGSTTNIYNVDNDGQHVAQLTSIQKITALIDERLKNDGATSGFEKLYTKLIWEYFGGMYLALCGIHKILKPGGKIDLLVSDSHAFKMVHIQTASILAEVGVLVGFSNANIELWQDKISTSHKYNIKENILTLIK